MLNFADAEFCENKTLQNDEITLSFTEIMPLSQIFNVANMSFNTFCENMILTKISEFTVSGFILCVLSDGMVKCKYQP